MSNYNLITTLDKLSKNAIFRISLSSKELFHSNFWAWMIEKYPYKFTSVFYSKYDGHTKPEVLREKYNFDLLLKLKNKSIIIENKFKSLPDKNQLERYLGKDTNLVNKELMLVSYIKPSFSWKNYISYNDLYSNLSNIDLSDIESKDKAIIENYIECIGLLIELQRADIYDVETLVEFWNKYNDVKLKEKLNEINFGLTIQRIFMGSLIDNLYKNIKYTNATFYTSTGNNHVVYVDFYGKNSEAFITLCCNGEYRYMFKILKSHECNTRENLIQFCNNKYGQFLSNKNCIKKRKDYNCFMDKECSWIYKRKDVSMITFKELANMISNDLIELEKFQ